MVTADSSSPHQAITSNALSMSLSSTHHSNVGTAENNDQLLAALPPRHHYGNHTQ